ncbi:MAG: hypothetical protein GF372_14770 [Candidatus Marinimicrobia bacterium]|nr:hypothetical protein [Candidatus Neomarinimicrobiota bacterium]
MTDTKSIFFILAMGRSGTKFLSNLLNNSSDAYVLHEPVREDFQAYIQAFNYPHTQYEYVKEYRGPVIRNSVKTVKSAHYGEVNSVLRRHIHALKDEFSEATFIHLVRDGRDVVRSMLARKAMTPTDKVTSNIFPHYGDPSFLKWQDYDRFEKLTWYWNTENEYLNQHIDHTICFERLISEYDYFCNKLTNLLKINISYEIWKKHINRPLNKSNEYPLSHWTEWDETMTDKFWNICYDQMNIYGYKASASPLN